MVPPPLTAPGVGRPPPPGPSVRAPAWHEPPGAASHPIPREEPFTIPSGYGDHRIVLMVRDPWWLYAYWEIDPVRERPLRSQLAPEEIGGLQSALRVYDVTGRDVPQQPAQGSFDIPLSGLANNWHIHVNAPNRSYVVDIGLLTRQGRFLMLARSNRVTTPRFGPSEVIDEEWMVADDAYWRLFGVTAGIGGASGGISLKEKLEQPLSSPGLFSPGVFSHSKPKPCETFSLTVDTELIVHGATHPKAAVEIQGQPLKTRADGTFSVRVALPEGVHTIPVRATSEDGREQRQVTTVVSRGLQGARADEPAAAPEPTPVATQERVKAARRRRKAGRFTPKPVI